MNSGSGQGTGHASRNSRMAAALVSSWRRVVAGSGSGVSGKRAVARSPSRKTALTVPLVCSFVIVAPAHCGTWSAMSRLTWSVVTSSCPSCMG